MRGRGNGKLTGRKGKETLKIETNLMRKVPYLLS